MEIFNGKSVHEITASRSTQKQQSKSMLQNSSLSDKIIKIVFRNK